MENDQQRYSVPDNYGYIPHKGRFILVQASFYSEKVPLEEMRDALSQVKPVIDEDTKRAKVFETLDDLLYYAWRKAHPEYFQES